MHRRVDPCARCPGRWWEGTPPSHPTHQRITIRFTGLDVFGGVGGVVPLERARAYGCGSYAYFQFLFLRKNPPDPPNSN